MAVSDPATDVPTPTGTLQGVAAFAGDGITWQPASGAGPSVATPTGVLRGVAPFYWSAGAWQPSGLAKPGVATPTGVLDGVAVYTWSGSAWTPASGMSSTPSGALRGVAGFTWDGAAWQPAGQAGPSVATPYGVLDGVALFNWNGSAWAAMPGPALDLSFMTPGSLDGRITFTRASTATYFDNTGTMQTAAINAPRWDYDPTTHVLNGLLIEEQRTNVFLNSGTPVTQNITVSAVAYTVSFYGTGTITLSGASTAGPLVGTGVNNRVSLTLTPTAGTLTLTVTGTVTNAQYETGAFPTSYIPTAGATVTRSADSALMNTSPWYTNPAAVSFVVDVLQPLQAGSPTYMIFDDGTNNNRMYVSMTAVFNSSATETVGGTSVYANSSRGAIPLGVPFRIGYVSAAGQHLYSLSGSNAATNPNASPPPIVTTLRLGKPLAATIGSFYLRRARYWPRALTYFELQGATT